ncbi:MAG TPA: hypothetical protein VMD27_10635 [Candidatus Aquilonibacter sp.]|nr:hypothetical protein [Candidatus Aquilonibacter sp.]
MKAKRDTKDIFERIFKAACSPIIRLPLEVASEAQPPKAGLPSANGCADARASSNHEADSSDRCADEKRCLRRREIIEDIIKRDDDPPLYKRAYPKWLKSLTDPELEEYYELVKLEHPNKPQTAAPCGQRASRRNIVLYGAACTMPCTLGFHKPACYHVLMKPDLRISVKDYRRDKNLKIQLARVSFSSNRHFWVRMNGQPWPKDGRPVSLTRLLTALRKSLVKSAG